MTQDQSRFILCYQTFKLDFNRFPDNFAINIGIFCRFLEGSKVDEETGEVH